MYHVKPSLCEIVFTYGVFSGPYFPAFGLNTAVRMRENTDQKKLRIWTLSMQCMSSGGTTMERWYKMGQKRFLSEN